ncbi:FMN-binding glutamate synthase family protein [Selenihalanaerobacter shriftii]|uniref:Glutamate synthase conserved region-containing protein n=1 Tax=Selenihalanaerobacter shriftii TaxID=142842 RepID=A0A1T4LZC4_9FIRM|nr:FMN-binding glutamate synthase family protein [Selenihalanaerobacter shriftii]SJZ60089.1 glutamate synthase conserved region-containing protein [Selenihalanaerobacter shriftii]
MISYFMRKISDSMMDSFMERLMKDKYTDNLYEMVTVTQKVKPKNLIETTIRAETGKPLSRPLGSPNVLSRWGKILFNPVHLVKFPIDGKTKIDTNVTIGPKAKKPLKIKNPIMIAGMSYGGALSKKMKTALAKAASEIETATNSGEAPLLEEEWENAKYFIGQYNRGGWMNEHEALKKLNAIEIQLGQGAQASASMKTPARLIGKEYRNKFRLAEGQPAVIHSNLPGVKNKEDFINLVEELRSEYGVPVGIKIAATHYLEKELDIMLQADVDFITIDGSEGGTHGGPTTLQDDVGLPTLHALNRATNYLEKNNVKDEVTLIITGGLTTPGHYLKALALGADAVYIGTMAVIAMVQTQMTKATLWEPPVDMMLYTGEHKEDFDIEEGVEKLVNYLKSCTTEMKQVVRTLGKTKLSELNRNDLCTVDKDIAQMSRIDYAGFSINREYDNKEFEERIEPFTLKDEVEETDEQRLH